MKKFTKMLENFTQVSSTFGSDSKALALAHSYLSPFGETKTDVLGNVICTVSKPDVKKTHLLLDAHLDEIGLVVTGVTDRGFLNISDAAGADIRAITSAEVLVHTKNGDLYGIVTSTPPHLSDKNDYTKAHAMDEVFIDIGFSSPKEVLKKVRFGDRITFIGPMRKLLDGRVLSKTLDDRAGCAAIIYALEKLKDTDLSHIGLSVSFSTMEEYGGQGAKTAAYTVSPSEAIVIDATPSDRDFVKPHQSPAFIGAGVCIVTSPILNLEFVDKLEELAKENSIKYMVKSTTSSRGTGTNADEIATSKNGVKTALFSIPQRYAHTSTEQMKLSDITAAGDLIVAYIKKIALLKDGEK